MAAHSSILPGKSHGQRGLSGLQPTGWQEAGHDLAHIHMNSGGRCTPKDVYLTQPRAPVVGWF